MLYLTQDLIPSTVFFCTSRVNGALTDLLFCVGGLSVAVAMDSERDAYKQIEAIVSASLLPQECKIECVKNCITVNPRHSLAVHNNEHIAG